MDISKYAIGEYVEGIENKDGTKVRGWVYGISKDDNDLYILYIKTKSKEIWSESTIIYESLGDVKVLNEKELMEKADIFDISKYALGEYVKGIELFGRDNKEKEIKGWVIGIRKDNNELYALDIQADDSFNGHRGTMIYEELGCIEVLEPKERPNLDI